MPHLLASAPLLGNGLEDWPYGHLRKKVPCTRLVSGQPGQERRFHGVPHARVNKKLQHCVKRQSTKRSANYSLNGIVSVLFNPLAQPVVH